jgi:hypothetical protein
MAEDDDFTNILFPLIFCIFKPPNYEARESLTSELYFCKGDVISEALSLLDRFLLPKKVEEVELSYDCP